MTLVQEPLEQVLAAIRRRWGPDALRPLGELSTQQTPLPTGITPLDDLVGGWPRGRLSLVTGRPTTPDIRRPTGTTRRASSMWDGRSTRRPPCAAALDNHEILAVSPGHEAGFLAPFTVELLPVDGETVRQLWLLGLVTLGHVAAQPVSALLHRFGKVGRVMHRLASGRDTRPVQPYTPRAVFRQTRQLEGAVADWPTLHAILDRLLAEVLAQVDGQTVRQVELMLLQDDGQRLENTLTLRSPSGDGVHLRQTVRELAQSLDVSGGVVEVALALSDLAPVVPRQLSLFERDPVSQDELRALLRILVARHREAGFFQIRLVDPDARLPERRFRLESLDEL